MVGPAHVCHDTYRWNVSACQRLCNCSLYLYVVLKIFISKLAIS